MESIIIAGSRGFNDYNLLKQKLDEVRKTIGKFEIVSGTAKGADSLGEQYAKEFDMPVIRFPAKWDIHGKKAGYLRNEDMAKYADACIVFWDGESKGTQHMINLAKQYKLSLAIINY